jgi:3-phenylpropionate/trans-cinnamate dioxygenase ferredoxin subunit
MALRVRVCTTKEIAAGKLKAFKVEHAAYPVMVTILDGETIAFPGYCPHDRVSLVDYGKLTGHEVTCRVHGYQFDLRTGECEHAPWLQLRRYKVTLVGNEIFVDLM